MRSLLATLIVCLVAANCMRFIAFGLRVNF